MAEEQEGFWEGTTRKGEVKITFSKEEIEALKELSKIDKNTWKDIASSVKSMADFVSAGGVSGFKEEIGTIIQENVFGALGPLYNELQPIINDVMRAIEPLMPIIIDLVKWATDILVPVIQWIVDTLLEIINFFSISHGNTFEEMLDIAEDLGYNVQRPRPPPPPLEEGGPGGGYRDGFR